MEREICIALIGDIGAGKTTFLASFFGNHQTASFVEAHGYSLMAQDPKVSNDLLEVFHGLERGSFPESTSHQRRYSFDVVYRGQAAAAKKLGNKAVVRITFLDYPGRWFSDGVDTTASEKGGEQAARDETLKWLADAHLGLILLDGSKWKELGPGYARKSLAQFKGELHKVSDARRDDVPRQWIVALTKADLLGDATAVSVGEEIRTIASEELRGFHVFFAGSRQLGTHFLLLSSVLVLGKKSIDPKRWIGLSVVAPFALKTVLADIVDAIRKSPPSQGGFLGAVLGLLGLIRRRLVKGLPKQYRQLGEIILMALEALGPALLSSYDKRQLERVAEEVKLGWAQIMAELETDSGKRAYANLRPL